MSTSESLLEWRSLSDLYGSNAIDLVNGSPQLAKDVRYAHAIQAAWSEEAYRRAGTDTVVEWTKISYVTTPDAVDSDNDDDDVALFGYCLRRQQFLAEDVSSSMAGIVLFHTGAGPHDIFLLWKADSLLHELNDVGYVLIADILSDPNGWAWSPDRARYDSVRNHVLDVIRNEEGRCYDAGPHRPVLQQRVTAAVNTLSKMPHINRTRIGAIGWCLGGHPIWEMAKNFGTAEKPMSDSLANNLPKIRCMATFHGVCDGAFDDCELTKSCLSHDASNLEQIPILICHGGQDPFISSLDLTRCIQTLQQYGYKVKLSEFPNAKHGFTNPAQSFNENPAFDYDAEAALEAWHQTLALFRERLANY